MPRTVRNPKLDTRSARSKVDTRREPYWSVLSQGCAVGYRKGTKGGTWVARLRDEHGKQHYESLGAADDVRDADGFTVHTFAQAQEKARAWFEQKARELAGELAPRTTPLTVADVIDEYLAWYKAHRKSYADTKAYCDAHIIPELGSVPVGKLTATRITKWHCALVEKPPRRRTRPGAEQNVGPMPDNDEARRARKATANRVLTILKSALNRAYAGRQIADNRAWKDVPRFRGVDSARLRFLNRDESIRLINAATPVFRPLVEAALYTGARYGELTRLRVADFRNGKLLVATAKSDRPRWISLTEEGRRFFDDMTLGRGADQPIFVKNGKPWGRSHQQEHMAAACTRAGLEPLGFHQLRHTYASLCLMGGMPLLVLARNLGHSNTRMVEQHYGHLIQEYEDRMVEKHAPSFGLVMPSNVTPLGLEGLRGERPHIQDTPPS